MMPKFPPLVLVKDKHIEIRERGGEEGGEKCLPGNQQETRGLIYGFIGHCISLSVVLSKDVKNVDREEIYDGSNVSNDDLHT